MIDTTTLLIGGAVLVALLVLYYYFYRKDKKAIPVAADTPAPATADHNTRALQLGAYERLVILADRIALPNLISRNNQPGIGKSDMQQLLTQTIKQEYEHNLSQQIYVSADAWDAVRNLKDQNIHLINQVASVLPQESGGTELNKKILDFIMSQPQGSLHTLVQEAISAEAKKLMK